LELDNIFKLITTRTYTVTRSLPRARIWTKRVCKNSSYQWRKNFHCLWL